MRYYEKDWDVTHPKKYQKLSAEQLDRRCRAWEKITDILFKIMPLSPKNVADKISVKFNFEETD